MDTLLAPVVSALTEHHPNDKLANLERAFLVAKEAHTGQLRKSGEEYITHPVAVAAILAEFGLNEAVVIAALLHDTVEDTSYSLTQLRKDFGDEIAQSAPLWLPKMRARDSLTYRQDDAPLKH